LIEEDEARVSEIQLIANNVNEKLSEICSNIPREPVD
jgi:hypothetical protein